ncbi:MAG: hypothetical protein ACI90V_000942 [Bacillariaceae sp.]|jgi:alkylated DNA repair protein alkB family protein 6
MEAIDFKKLLREERKRNKKSGQQNNKIRDQEETKKLQKNDTVPVDHGKENNINWNYPNNNGFLELRELRLRSICENPNSISYSSTALQKTCEAALTNWLKNIPSGDNGLGNWKTMKHGLRRVCMFGEEKGQPEFQQPQKQEMTIMYPLPPPLAEIARELVKRDVFPSSCPPNHVLLNEYQPGQGILSHTDGPIYEHRTATLSLGSSIVIEFTKRLAADEIGIVTKTRKTILLESGSLLVFQGDAYLSYCHGIPMDVLQDITTDECLNAPPHQIVSRGLRYSLTFRHKKETSNSE